MKRQVPLKGIVIWRKRKIKINLVRQNVLQDVSMYWYVARNPRWLHWSRYGLATAASSLADELNLSAVDPAPVLVSPSCIASPRLAVFRSRGDVADSSELRSDREQTPPSTSIISDSTKPMTVAVLASASSFCTAHSCLVALLVRSWHECWRH